MILPEPVWPGNTRVRATLALDRVYADWALPATTDDEFVTGPPIAVVVNLSRQRLTVFSAGRRVRTMTVSTGAWPHHVTPTGRFWIWKRLRQDRMVGGIPGTPSHYIVEPVPFVQYLWRGIALHGAWWNHQLGRPVSHGCIQLATRDHNPDPGSVPEDAGWLWDHTRLGTPVTVVGTTPHDPLTPLAYPTHRRPTHRSVQWVPANHAR